MTKRKQYADDDLKQALEFIHNKQGSTREAAKKFNVPRSTLQFKIINPDKKSKPGPDPVLTEVEEKQLGNFVIDLARRGFPIKKEDLLVCVQDFLTKNPRQNPFKDNKPGETWFKAFLKRNPNISSRTSEGVTSASSCVSEQDIRKWFNEISQYINENGLTEVMKDASRVFNADETGFNICPKSGKVLAEKGSKNVYQIEKAPAKENITVLFTFSASGLVLNPMIIFPYKRIPDKVTLSVPSGWGIGRSDSGWMTAAVFHDYIENCFYKELIDKNIHLPVVLFVDGHKTHITVDVAELCRTLKIHLIALYPNATRILQPADVAAFRPIKVGWKRALQEWYAENNYQISMTKERFAPLLKKVVISSIKQESLVNGFRVCGLFPFNANNVDYSKCLALSNRADCTTDYRDSELLREPDYVSYSNMLTYEEFYNVLGPTLITKCQQTVDILQLECDDSFKAIYRLWLKFTGSREHAYPLVVNCSELPNFETFESLVENDMDMAVVEQNDIILDDQTGELRNRNEKKTEKVKVNDITSNEIETEEQKTNEIEARELKTKETENNEVEVKEIKVYGTMTSQTEAKRTECKKIKIIQQDMSVVVTKERNNGPSDPYFDPQPGPSRQRDPNKLITIISNQPLSEYLKIKTPSSPKRQGKRQTERFPFAMTSDLYLEKMKTKQLKKQEEEAAKEERKRLREEKKSQKENTGPKKKAKKLAITTNTKKIIEKDQLANRIVCCDSCLCPIRKRVMKCSQCLKKFHLNCIPSFHRIHIPDEDEGDDSFLCHLCYRESNTDSSASEGEFESLFSLLKKEAKK